MTICLVGPTGSDSCWSLPRLQDELVAAGHRVELRDPANVEAVDAEVVHCFGWEAARQYAARAESSTLLVTPSPHGVPDVAPEEAERLATAAASVVVRSSREQEEVHRLGVPWFRTWVLPVGVDAATFTRLGPMANRTDRFRVVTTASAPDDGVEDLIAALAKLDDVEVVALVEESQGAPPDALTERVDELRSAARAAGVSDRFAVVTPGSPGERAWWLRSAHVAVAVPHAPMGHDFVAQAMSCGAAVVATPVDALFDMVVHGVTGFHVSVGEPLSLARAVRTVIEDEFAVEAYGMAAADRALSRFDWPRVAHELAGIYARVGQGSLAPEEPEPEEEEALPALDLLALDDTTTEVA
jgi:glycosyltransferase involved in cell wall biosynthesis